MGRAERRRLERVQRHETKRGNISMSPYEYRQAMRETADRIATFDVELLHTCYALSLYDVFGLDGDDIAEGLEYIDDIFGRVLGGEVSARGLADELEEKTGVVVKFSKEW